MKCFEIRVSRHQEDVLAELILWRCYHAYGTEHLLLVRFSFRFFARRFLVHRFQIRTNPHSRSHHRLRLRLYHCPHRRHHPWCCQKSADFS